jgi:hypothetical protein
MIAEAKAVTAKTKKSMVDRLIAMSELLLSIYDLWEYRIFAAKVKRIFGEIVAAIN